MWYDFSMNKALGTLSQNMLYAVVFFTGGAILVVEITATRILSPYFGNTIYTVSAVISVILGALSLGYWRGGIRADKEPRNDKFFLLVSQSGLGLFLMYVLMNILLPVFANFFSIRIGPLFWSLLLFFFPSYIMGMLSPFAITLLSKERGDEGLGTISGRMFFWSTFGSILGSLLTGFLFIPHFGVSAIIATTTALVLLLGCAGRVACDPNSASRVLTETLFVIITIFAIHYVVKEDLRASFVYARDGIYERLVVHDGWYEGVPARFFLQDRSSSGAMYLDGSGSPFGYPSYATLYRAWKPDMKRALVVGAGIFTIPKYFHKERPDAIVDVVDIEPGLRDIAEHFFSLPPATEIVSHVGDGRRFIADTKEPYDVIFSDVYYSLYSIPAHMTTQEFFGGAKNKLTENGIFLANIIGANRDSEHSLLYSEIRTMKSVFPNMYVFAVEDPGNPMIQNFVLVGVNGGEHVSAREIAEKFPDDPILLHLPDHELTPSDEFLARYPILTDDHAPVEYLVTDLVGSISERSIKRPEVMATPGKFRGDVALRVISGITDLGSRAIGTGGHKKLASSIMETLQALNIEAMSDSWVHTRSDGTKVELKNIIGRINPASTKRIILGTHYDSIARAYRDKKDPNGYMPGANNSASGVAVLLEVARQLTERIPDIGVDLFFFDGEEGELALGAGDPNWKPLGSTRFATTLKEVYKEKLPMEAIIVDMVCDKNLTLPMEGLSLAGAETQVKKFWDTGKTIAPDVFLEKKGPTVYDDHLPLTEAGIPAYLLIDFDYEPWFNTTEDTPDKCSAKSLSTVGDTIIEHVLSLNAEGRE